MTAQDPAPYAFPHPATDEAPTPAAAPRPAAQDHLPKQSKADQIANSVEPPLGHDFLKPVESLRSGEIAAAQADMLDLFAAIGIDLANPGEHEIETTPEVLRGFGSLGELLEKFCLNLEGYQALDTGKGAQGRVTELAMWYLGQLGESEGSATS